MTLAGLACMKDTMEKIRLQKFFTDCGVLSRRAAEEEIRAGRVRVNGEIAEIGAKIDPEVDVVEYRGKRVEFRGDQPRHYLLLNKPRGFVTTLSDERGRPTVMSFIKDLGYRVYPVGRLDMDSDGMLLLTDDGALTQRLTHPRHEITKQYRVTVKGEVSEEQLARLREPFLIGDYYTQPARVKYDGKDGDNACMIIEIHEGRNRQIRQMCEQVELRVMRLTRVAIGNITLGSLPQGHYRHLSDAEVAYLKGGKK